MGYFLHFYCPNSPKNQNFEKMNKTPGDIIILHMCTKNHDQIIYSSWNMVHDRCNYFSFWVIYCPFTPLTARKIKILKKWKKCLEISSFYVHAPKINRCTVPQIWCMTDVIICHVGSFFALLLPQKPEKSKFWKMKKLPGDTIILHMCTKNYDQMMYSSSDMLCDRQMDGQTEKVTYRGGCPI